MNYKEAIKHSLTVKWKTSPCFTGNKCWCRVIEPQVKIKDDDGNEIYIAGSGMINKEHAKYLVKIHNQHIKKIK